MNTRIKPNRLNGHCPDRNRCALLPFACVDNCWRMEPDLIEAARVSGAQTVGEPVRPTSTRAGKNTLIESEE